MKRIIRAYCEHMAPGQPELQMEEELLDGVDIDEAGRELLWELYNSHAPGAWEIIEVDDNYELV